MLIKNIQGVLGNTKYLSSNSFEKSFLAATYGEKELTTVLSPILSLLFKSTLLETSAEFDTTISFFFSFFELLASG